MSGSEPSRHPGEWQLATAYVGLVASDVDPAVPADLLGETAARWHLGQCEGAPAGAIPLRDSGGHCTWRTEQTASLPERDSDNFSFLAWSCDEPYAYDSHHQLSLRARHVLSHRMLALRAEGRLEVEGHPTPSLGIAMGDQVYVDPHPKYNGPERESLGLFGGFRSGNWRTDAHL